MVQLLKKRINAIHVYFKALVVHNKQIQIEVCPPMLFKKVLTTASRYKLMSMRNEIVKIEKEKLDSILNELDTLSKYLDDRIVELHSERYNWRNGAKFGYNIKESVDVDWKKLRDDFFDEHIQKDTGGYIHITTAPHDLFEWFKSKLSTSQNTVSNEGEWISVKDRLPEEYEMVLIWAEKSPYISTYTKNEWLLDLQVLAISEQNKITHWKSINPPKEK